ncbi:MAG: AAA family ATPase, partial [Pseudomonadota bacterium]
MYIEHFNLLARPFNLRPDPEYLFLSDHHSMALRMLEYGLFEQDGYTVITGEVGSGKTTLIRYLLNAVEDDYQIGLISNTHKSFGDLLHWVASAFGIRREKRTDAELYEAFIDFLVAGYEHGKRTLLIIDEAQNLDIESLEEIRLLSNINADGVLVLQLLMVGQPEFRELLQRRELRQVAQRISTHYHLEPLDLVSAVGYIRHRLLVAGA